MPQAGCTRDVDAAVYGVDPRGTGVWDHDTRGTQDRDAANDAEARIPGLLGQTFAIRYADLYVDVAVMPVLLGGGISLLPAPAPRATLALENHRVFEKSGIAVLEYDIVPAKRTA